MTNDNIPPGAKKLIKKCSAWISPDAAFLWKASRSKDSPSYQDWAWARVTGLASGLLALLGIVIYFDIMQPEPWWSYKIPLAIITISFAVCFWILPSYWKKGIVCIGKLKSEIKGIEGDHKNEIARCNDEKSNLQRQIAAQKSKTICASPSKVECEKTLEQFSEWVIDAINKNTSQLHLAINTPLLHCFHRSDDGLAIKKYERKMPDNHPVNHWAQLFCGPLATKLNGGLDKESLDFRFLYLDPNTQKVTIRWFPFFEEKNFEEYTKQISSFRKDISASLGKEEDNLFQETDMLPLWIAVVRNKNDNETESGQVILALTGQEDLSVGTRRENGESVDNMDMHERKIEARKVADGVVVLRSADMEIVNFFDQVFRRQTLRNYHMIGAIRKLLREGEWKGLDLMFRADYHGHKHGQITPDEVKDVLYSYKAKREV
ncbi:MAG: hypothetical protein K8S14_10985 [Actinomycetia bacterium]|nr:hypothetical protein [Actinomycetes bacterium]